MTLKPSIKKKLWQTQLLWHRDLRGKRMIHPFPQNQARQTSGPPRGTQSVKRCNNMFTHTWHKTHTHTLTHMMFIQINLHHSRAATAALCQRLAEGKTDVALIRNLGFTRVE
jgi:hypothetical protein